MKTCIKFVLASMFLTILLGCASSDYQARHEPPDAFNPVFLQYKSLPTNKVMVIAVDPTGQWAYGYEDGAATLEEAAIKAAVKCDIARDKFQVTSKGQLFSINDQIVYYDQQLQ